MEIKKKYLQRYLHSMAIDQLSDEYIQKGYLVSKETRFGKYTADLVAHNDNETLVFEIKTGKLTPHKKEAIKNISDHVKSKGDYKFLIVVATPPKEKKLEICDLSQLLFNEIMMDMPDKLDSLATHAYLRSVDDVDIDEIIIDGKDINVKGDAVVSATFQYGSDGDQCRGDGYQMNDSFPFDYDIVLRFNGKGKLDLEKVNELSVNTDSFYGDEND